MSEQAELFERMGGIEGCRGLAQAFYRGVPTDPVLQHIYGRSLHCPTEQLGAFIAHLCGGESNYLHIHGAARLRHTHKRFRIGQVERDAWVRLMDAAVDEMGYEEPLRSELKRYFAEAATHLINRPAACASGKRGYASYPSTADADPLEKSWARMAAGEKLYDLAAEGDIEGMWETIGDGLAPLENLLLQAAEWGQMGMMRFLMEQGAEAKKLMVSGRLLVQQREAAELLLSWGASVNAPPGKRPPLVEATRGDKGENVDRVRLLLDRGAEIDAVTPDGRTALHYAARAGFLQVMELLITRGAAVNTADRDGETPLLGAVRMGKRDAALRLLDAGADVNATLLKSGWSGLHLAGKRGDAAMMTLLVENGALPSPRDPVS